MGHEPGTRETTCSARTGYSSSSAVLRKDALCTGIRHVRYRYRGSVSSAQRIRTVPSGLEFVCTAVVVAVTTDQQTSKGRTEVKRADVPGCYLYVPQASGIILPLHRSCQLPGAAAVTSCNCCGLWDCVKRTQQQTANYLELHLLISDKQQ